LNAHFLPQVFTMFRVAFISLSDFAMSCAPHCLINIIMASRFSGVLQLTDLDDFIAPSQVKLGCVFD
jgi:hypothetical protein